MVSCQSPHSWHSDHVYSSVSCLLTALLHGIVHQGLLLCRSQGKTNKPYIARLACLSIPVGMHLLLPRTIQISRMCLEHSAVIMCTTVWLVQVALLSPVAATNEALHAQLSDLRKDLQQAQASAALLPQEAARADKAQAACRRLEDDAATNSSQMSRLEDKLRSTEQKLQEAQGTALFAVLGSFHRSLSYHSTVSKRLACQGLSQMCTALRIVAPTLWHCSHDGCASLTIQAQCMQSKACQVVEASAVKSVVHPALGCMRPCSRWCIRQARVVCKPDRCSCVTVSSQAVLAHCALCDSCIYTVHLLTTLHHAISANVVGHAGAVLDAHAQLAQRASVHDTVASVLVLMFLYWHAGMVSDAQQAHAELAHSYQEEMEGLANRPPSAWPSQVRQLVDSRERAAVSSAEAAAHAEAEATEAEFEADSERLRQTAAECRSKQQQAQAQM